MSGAQRNTAALAMVFVLRPHQERAIAAVRDAYRRVRRVLLVAPTGFGKTAVAAAIIAWAVAKGRRVLFLVHLREIVLDTHRRLVAAGVQCAIIMAGERAAEAQVYVASIQTIIAREAHPEADLVVFDEAHRTASRSYREVASQYEGAWFLGLTATPVRSDGQGLRDAFDELVIGATVAELQSTINPATGHTYLAPLDVIAPPGRQEGGVLAADPLEAWFAHAGGRSTILFARSVAESKEYAARFNERGVAARQVDGTTPKSERDATLRALAAGDVTVVTNAAVLVEGFDAPRVKAIVLARSCGAVGAFLQMIGRGLREYNGERALLLDLAGNVREHGLPDEPREFTLDGIARRPKKEREWIRQCLACGFTVLGTKAGRVCARCKTPWPALPGTTVQPAPLSRVTRENMPSGAVLRAAFDALVEEAEARGYKPLWACLKFKEEWGFWPRRFVR